MGCYLLAGYRRAFEEWLSANVSMLLEAGRVGNEGLQILCIVYYGMFLLMENGSLYMYG